MTGDPGRVGQAKIRPTGAAKENQQKDITILDVYEDMAGVKVVFTGRVDYVHMARFNGRWVIVNVL